MSIDASELPLKIFIIPPETTCIYIYIYLKVRKFLTIDQLFTCQSGKSSSQLNESRRMTISKPT